MDSSSSSSPSLTPRSDKDDSLDNFLYHRPKGTTPIHSEPPNTAPLLPQTGEQLLIFLIYPSTLLLSSISSVLTNPNPSYFSQKRNVFNTFFVKYGWFWTSLIFFFHINRLRRSSPSKAFLRWLLASTWWYFVTQWCLGPPIMDRMFLFTGGKCESVYPSTQTHSQHMEAQEALTTTKLLVTSAACKLAGGQWAGGHDLSGHVFLLTHASLFLWMEFLPILFAGSDQQRNSWPTWSMGGLLGLWWWMLVMTGVHFHTWREKFTGFLASLLEWGFVYVYAIPSIAALRDILGVPGV